MNELFYQTIDPVSIILGVKFVELGLREKDRRCNKKLKAFREFVTNFVHNRLYEIEQEIANKGSITEAKDLIEAFYLEAGEEGVKEKKKEFVDNLINDFANLYTAGTDTTEHATMMMVYFIHKFPGVKERLMKELQEHSVNPDDLKYESIKNLTFLEAICFETLRLYQTANGIFPREVLSPVAIGGVTL